MVKQSEIKKYGKRILDGIEGDSIHDKERYQSNKEAAQSMLLMMLDDAEEFKVDLGAEREALLERLEKSRPSFDAYTVPRLVHYDLWENNLIDRDGEIVGVLD